MSLGFWIGALWFAFLAGFALGVAVAKARIRNADYDADVSPTVKE